MSKSNNNQPSSPGLNDSVPSLRQATLQGFRRQAGQHHHRPSLPLSPFASRPMTRGRLLDILDEALRIVEDDIQEQDMLSLGAMSSDGEESQ